MTEVCVSFAGNPTDDPSCGTPESGIARQFRGGVGSQGAGASFFTVIVWRDQAEHASESPSKGSRVVVVGSAPAADLTAEDGSACSAVEVGGRAGAEPRWARRPHKGDARSQSQ
jgi:single-stranded DNA-binding protein